MRRDGPALAGNRSTGILKVLALVFMFCDHAGKMLLPAVPEMRMLGRIAFPLYCWCIVVGFEYTRSVPKYMLRLLLVGLISQPLYAIALEHYTWREPNIMLTLILGLGAIWAIREKRLLSHIWGPAAALALAVLTSCNYGWRGVLFIVLLYAARKSSGGIAAMMAAYCLFWGNGSSTVTSFFGLDLVRLTSQTPLKELASPWLRLQALSVLALPLIVIPFRKDIRLPKWLGYAMYPGHLVILYILEMCLKPNWLAHTAAGLARLFPGLF